MPFLRDRLKGTGLHGGWALAGVALSMMLGGGDTAAPWMDNILEAVVALIVLGWFWTAPRARVAAIPPMAWVIAGLIVVLPLVQLIPLPPGFWHALPGRDVERQALALVGQDNSWRPLSMTPDRSFSAALAAAGAAIFVPLVAAADRSGRSRIMVTIVTVAVISALIGTQQLAGGTRNIFMFYGPTSHLHGFQWNRNSEADVLLIAMLAQVGCARELLRLADMERHRRLVMALGAGLAVLLALCVVLTGSRTGILLIVPVALTQLAFMLPHLRRNRALLLLPLAGTLALAMVWSNPVLVSAFAHFHDSADMRPGIWADSLALARQQAVWGVGLGGYSPAFATVERLDLVNPLFAAHAYEDYVQLLIEGGLAGMAVMLAIAGMVGWAIWRGIAAPVLGSRAQYLFAVATLVLLALHALWDYPFHASSLACIAACCIGLLLPVRRVTTGGEA